MLKIHRTFRNPEGKEFTRVEIVRKPAVIDTYIKIRNSKDETFIKQFATLDEAAKEEMKREKRRIQEQLRRIKRNQERERMLTGGNSHHHHHHRDSMGLERSSSGMNLNGSNNSLSNPHFPSQNLFDRSGASTPTQPGGTTMSNSSLPAISNFPPSSLQQLGSSTSTPNHQHAKPHHKAEQLSGSPSKRKKSKLKPDLKLKCGACGNVGHMRTNKACPLYQNSIGGMSSSMNVAMTEEQEEEIEKQLNTEEQDLVNIDGTKVKLSSKLIKVCSDGRLKCGVTALHGAWSACETASAIVIATFL